ncbi:MAG: hypothetical protein ACR2N3_05620 [Pyrinomonadaceae bacterium]
MKSIIPVAFIFLLLVLGCGQMSNIAKKSSTNFNPYQGKLSELLPEELSSGLIKFKLVGVVDNSTFTGSTEAKGFTYMQDAAGVEIKVDGALANYPTASAANAEITDIAKKFQGTLTTKGDGQRFLGTDGTLAWTNGSLLCIVKAGVAKAATNFEDAAPF